MPSRIVHDNTSIIFDMVKIAIMAIFRIVDIMTSTVEELPQHKLLYRGHSFKMDMELILWQSYITEEFDFLHYLLCYLLDSIVCLL